MSNTNVWLGAAAIAFGIVVFVVATGAFILQVIGAVLAYIIINYGLQLMGKPPLLDLIQEWFNDARY